MSNHKKHPLSCERGCKFLISSDLGKTVVCKVNSITDGVVTNRGVYEYGVFVKGVMVVILHLAEKSNVFVNIKIHSSKGGI